MFGGYDGARFVHFFAMATIVRFVVVHVLMALLVPKSLRAMIPAGSRRSHGRISASVHARRRQQSS